MNRILSDGSHVVQFDVTANFGFGYSSTTGKFICSHPGLYFFAATLIKRRNNVDPVDVLECFIDRNKSYLVKTYIDPTDDDTDNGSYETSAFVVVHLSQGDQVYVRCDDGKLDYESSFSGFLIQSD